MSEALTTIARAIRDSPAHELATFILSSIPGAPPIAQTIHILAIGAVFASSVFLALRVLGVAIPSQALAEITPRVMPWFWWALPVLLVTGLLFVCARPTRYFSNPVFGLKMALLVLSIASAACLQSRARSSAITVSTKMVAALCVLLWLTIVLAGRWIAYVDYLLPME